METRANYALIGLFTLAVIAASFLFIYWVSSPGRSGSQQTYKIIFTGSINGLGRGGWVMFNGVRVGEVKEINLVPQDPQHVYALINIDSRVPIRADTQARLESTGFTGVSVVALSGGKPDAEPLPKSPDGGPAIIYAESSGFQDLLESARHIAGQASDLIDKGSKLATDADTIVKAVDPDKIKSIVANVNTMSTKLNAATDKADSVLTSLNGFLGSGDSKGTFGEVTEAAKSIHKLADDLDVRSKELFANLNHFSSAGLHQYEALAIDGRKTLAEIDQAVRSIEENPQQFIFGKKKLTLPPEVSSNR